LSTIESHNLSSIALREEELDSIQEVDDGTKAIAWLAIIVAKTEAEKTFIIADTNYIIRRKRQEIEIWMK